MSTDAIFHLVEIFIQSGLLICVITVIWRASAVVQDFHGVKQRQEEHIREDKEQFVALSTSVVAVERCVARIEGRLGTK